MIASMLDNLCRSSNSILKLGMIRTKTFSKKLSDWTLQLDVEDEDSSVLKTFAIGEYMDKSGYDWTEADLEDVVIVLDYSVTGLRVVFKGWDKEYTYDIIL